MLKKLFLFFSLLISLLLVTTVSIAAFKPSFNKVVFLGDSLTDNGNLYRHTNHLIPSYLPYYKGRFTDGYTWADRVGYTLYSKYNIKSTNYAVGGATTILHNPLSGYLPVTADMEITDYEAKNALKNKDNTLYAIWFGANDYLKGAKDVDKATTDVVNAISAAVDKLVVHKHAEFLIVGLPNLAYTPGARIHHLKDVYQQLSTLHNQKLHEAVVTLQAKYPNTKMVEFSFVDHPLLQKMVESKTYRDQINKKYGTDITNVTAACIPMVWSKPPALASVQMVLSKKQQATQPHSVNSTQLANEILNSPALAATYRAEQAYDGSQSVCAHPSQYVFWDDIHPTAVAHRIIAAMIMDELFKDV